VDSDKVTALEQKIDKLQQIRSDEQAAAANKVVDDWIDANSASLFVNGDQSQGLAPYGVKFTEFEDKVLAWAGPEGKNMSRAELNSRTRQLLESAGITPESMTQQQGAAHPQVMPAGQQAAQQPQTFMQTLPQQGVENRLHEHAAFQPAAQPQIPMGKGGLPTLHHYIQANPNQLQG